MNTMFRVSLIFTSIFFCQFAHSAETKATVQIIEAAKSKPADELFRAGEVQFDAIYQARTDSFDRFTHGGGLGLTYFATKNFGLGVEGRTEKPESAFFDRLGLAVVGRLPVESLRLAPELRVGFDYDLEDSWEAGEKSRRTGFDTYAGVGAEYRVTKSFGIGAEARSVFPVGEQERNHFAGLVRLRLNF